MAAWETDTSFRDRVKKDDRIAKYLDSKALAHTFDLQRQLRYVDAIFDRVFGAHPAGEKSAAGSAGKKLGKKKKRPRPRRGGRCPLFCPPCPGKFFRRREPQTGKRQPKKKN